MSTTTQQANKDVARRFIEGVFERQEAVALDELATDDFTPHTYGPMPPGREPMKIAMARVGAGLSEVRFEIEDMIAEGDRVAVRLTASARHTGAFMGLPASGNRYTIGEIHIFRIRDGRVAEHWHAFDSGALIRQLQAPRAAGSRSPSASPTSRRRRG